MPTSRIPMPRINQPTANQPMIHQVEPWIDEGELQQLARVVDSSFVVEHELTREFESMTARLSGSKHAIAVCNGTMGLFVCLKALGIGAGDEVIVPDLTFVATANAVILAGARPVFCEIRADTFCIDVSRAAALVTDRTRAIMPVHLYGQSADMGEIKALACRYGLRVVEDAAQGVGVRFAGQHVGTLGDCGVLSYYGNKTITCGEGGVVLTGDDSLAKAIYRLKNHGRDRKGTFVHDTIGFNFSFTEMQAAVGLAQMKKLPAIIARKREIRGRYCEGLSGLKRFREVYMDPRCEPVFWFTSFLCDDTEALAAFLATRKVQTRRFFYPLHLQPCYADGTTARFVAGNFATSESAYEQGISLPSSYGLTCQEQSYVIEQIRLFYESRM
jgi:perosamine synthetase